MDNEVTEITKRKQSNISSFFGGSAKKAKADTNSSSSLSTTTSTTRKLQVSTAEKWKSTTLAKYNADEWLIINENNANKGFVKTLKCATCMKFRERIISMKGFTPQWSEHGSTRLLHAAALEHASSEAHKKSFDLHMRQKGLAVLDRRDALQDILTGSKQTDILTGISSMQKVDVELTKKKFEVAYFIAKEELPLIKYKAILSLEEKHGVTLGNGYRNENTGGVFIDYISKTLCNSLKSKLEKVNFYAILTDGSTDTSISDNEAVFVLYFDPSPPGLDKIKIMTSFVKLVHMKSADAPGVIECMKDAFTCIGIEEDFYAKLVGFGSDGASVNRGRKEGVKTILQRDNEWLTFGWCVAHRMELALKDGLSGTSFDDVDNLILNMYYLYKKSPKKLRQLQQLVGIYEEADEFCEGGFRPKKASGKTCLNPELNMISSVIPVQSQQNNVGATFI